MSTDLTPGSVPSTLVPLAERDYFPCAWCKVRFATAAERNAHEVIGDAVEPPCAPMADLGARIAKNVNDALELVQRAKHLPVTGNDLGALAAELKEHFAPPQTAAQAFAAVKHATQHNVTRRPLVMKFHGSLSAAELERRFKLIDLEAVSDCCGDVCVRERRGNTKLERLELLRAEISRLRAEHEEDCAQYVMDEQRETSRGE